MILNTESVTPGLREESIHLAETVFDTSSHPDYIQPGLETAKKFSSLSPDCVLYYITDDGKLAGWVVSVPTSREIMEKFLQGAITEKGLLDLTVPASHYSALYLCAAVTLPEYRRQGIAIKLAQEALRRINLTSDAEVCAWPTTSEGARTVEKLGSITGRVIHIKK
jgi:ribosomal protein S18 acetylase RimI-like enzyme